MQVLELPREGEHAHPFFIGTQAHPEMHSRPLEPSPLFVGLVNAALARSASRSANAVAEPETSRV